MFNFMQFTFGGGWFSSHGLTPKGLGGGGSRFEFRNRKRLGYNFTLLTHAN